jgi:AAA+ ATPase superfamily predicted ATPase
MLKTKPINNKIMINENVGIVMKFPSVTVLESAPDNPELTSVVEYLVRSCIDQIFDENDVYLASDTPEEEMAEFVDNLDIETFTKIREFFDSLPSLYYKIEYTNALGNKREIELTTLSDFFTWG